MAQKVTGLIKLQIPAGKATPAPPVGPALGQHGVNIVSFTKEFNERTKNDIGLIIPVVITVYADRSFTFITKDSARTRSDQEGLRHRDCFRRAQQEEGRQDHQGAVPADRRAEDEGPERRYDRNRDIHDHGYRSLDGHRGRRLKTTTTSGWEDFPLDHLAMEE